MIYGVYTAVLAGAMAVYAPVALGRKLSRGVPLNLRARLGYAPRTPRPGGRRGFTRCRWAKRSRRLPLVAGLRDLYPDLPLVVTTVTETGARVVRERLGALAEHRYFPLDLPGRSIA